MEQFNTITSLVYAGLIASTVITGGVSITTFTSGTGLLVDTALRGTSLFFLLQELHCKNPLNICHEARRTRGN